MPVREGRPSAAGAPAAPLGLHEEISNGISDERLRCTCGMEFGRLLSEHGELVAPRGKSPNKCEYCARLAAIETCETLALDALEGEAPAVLLVLGTRTAFPAHPGGSCSCTALHEAQGKPEYTERVRRDGTVRRTQVRPRCPVCSWSVAQMAPYSRAHQAVAKALRLYWPAMEYASVLEFTTGKAKHSGGLRRPHWNWLLKGIPASDAKYVEWVAAAVWCHYVDAEPQAQHATSIYATGGLMKYLALHFTKQSQQPPRGFTGKRFSPSRGYFSPGGNGTAGARARGVESLRLKRETWKVQQQLGPLATAEEVHDLSRAAYARASSTRWMLATASGAPASALLPRLEGRKAWAAFRVRQAHREALLMEAERVQMLNPDWLQWIEQLWVPSPYEEEALDVGGV